MKITVYHATYEGREQIGGYSAPALNCYSEAQLNEAIEREAKRYQEAGYQREDVENGVNLTKKYGRSREVTYLRKQLFSDGAYFN